MSFRKSARRVVQWQGAPSAENDALSHGMAMVAVPVAFGFLGLLVDGWLGTGWIFVVVFAAFGVACSFGSAYYRYERRIAQHDEGKPWARARDPLAQDRKEALG